MARVVVLQPYVPEYRVAFFEALGERLAARGHDLVVASGRPSGSQAQRDDSAHLNGVRQRSLRVRTVRIGRARIRLSSVRAPWRDADVIVAELAAGATVTFAALLQRRRSVAVWGHVGAFVEPDTAVTRRLRRWQARSASHVLAYTARGAAVAESWGVDPARTTTLLNTTNTAGLVELVDQQTRDGVPIAGAELGTSRRPTFAMIGGLDASKGVDLVVETLDLLWVSRPDVQLFVGGRGAMQHAFDRAVARGQVRLLGYVADEQKAALARTSIALLNPGRVGLIAVESMAMRLPIITTRQARHGPEYEYLTPGLDCVQCEATAPALAAAMLRLADDPGEANQLAAAARAKLPHFSLDHMVDTFAEAVLGLIREHDADRIGRRRGRRARS